MQQYLKMNPVQSVGLTALRRIYFMRMSPNTGRQSRCTQLVPNLYTPNKILIHGIALECTQTVLEHFLELFVPKTDQSPRYCNSYTLDVH